MELQIFARKYRYIKYQDLKLICYRKAKPQEVINFYNNVESVWDHVVKLNKCFKLDRKTEYFVTAGSADKHDAPIEAIANCALDMMDAGHRGLMRPDNGKPIKITVRDNLSPIDSFVEVLYVSALCWLWDDRHGRVLGINPQVRHLRNPGDPRRADDGRGPGGADPAGAHHQEPPARHVQGQGVQGGGWGRTCAPVVGNEE